MKMKKSLLSVVFLLATSSAMAAMSYSSASVTSDMNVSLVDTSNALLALEASPDHIAAGYDKHTAKTLNLDLNKGHENSFGVQEHSVYTWNDLFKVTNNSEHAVNASVETNPNTDVNRVEISSKTEESGWVTMLNTHSPGGKLTFKLLPGESKWIDIKTDASNGVAAPNALKLIVKAEKIVTP